MSQLSSSLSSLSCSYHLTAQRYVVAHPRARSLSSRSLRRRGCALKSHRALFVCAQEDDDKPSGDDSTGSLFAEELAKRGIKAGDPSSVKTEDPFATKSPASPPPFARDSSPAPAGGQLEKSRLLNSEGIEGFPTRLGELLKLGTTFFLALLPIVGVTAGLSVATYLLFGEEFIHIGQYEGGGGAPPYIDPYVLLSEPTYDRMVPLE